jgi:hypothetical protein
VLLEAPGFPGVLPPERLPLLDGEPKVRPGVDPGFGVDGVLAGAAWGAGRCCGGAECCCGGAECCCGGAECCCGAEWLDEEGLLFLSFCA